MSISTCELTDGNSVIQRLKLRLAGCSIGAILLLAITLLFIRHLLMPVIATCLFLVLYMSGIGFALDRWRLSHPAISKQTVYALAILLILPIFPVMFLCFNLIS